MLGTIHRAKDTETPTIMDKYKLEQKITIMKNTNNEELQLKLPKKSRIRDESCLMKQQRMGGLKRGLGRNNLPYWTRLG